MAEPSLGPYQRVNLHEAASGIIRRRSLNPEDVREVALHDLDLSDVREILDLGCGFGFMEEVLVDRVAPEAHFVGVDNWCSNEDAFLQRIAAAGHHGEFECLHLDAALRYPDDQFDVIVCSYSLYFFIGLVPEIARVLAPDGVFVALTHSERHVAGELVDAGYVQAAANLHDLVRAFSAENGAELLRPWFAKVTRIDYHNLLRFLPEHVGELASYLRFKLPQLFPGVEPGSDLPDGLAHHVESMMARRGEVILAKNDAIFRCRRPLCP